ncbi:MAG TPA: hypothetical protein VF828_04420, partial [Patescibacteria group bacterium]
GKIEIEGVVKIASGDLVVYHSINQWGQYLVGIALISIGAAKKILWRSPSALWESSTAWLNKKVNFIGMAYVDGKLIGYWGVNQKQIHAVVYPSFKARTAETAEHVHIKMHKHRNNPLISPSRINSWESFCTFNPAAIYEGGKVHILYRAQGFDYVSVVGYATSSDGVQIDERFDEPIYVPREPFEWACPANHNVSSSYQSGGGYGGIEDPRITRVEDKIYMAYVAFNGIDPPRIALTSIKVDDFLDRRWLWEKPVLISPPGIVDKSPVIFPEKINGKYVILHRVFPDILIDFVDDLNFDGNTWLKGEFKISPRPKMWDSRKIGAGAPPIRTKDGWLLIYYATCDQEGASRYLIGAMLLDLEDPTKVLHRSSLPIVRPEEKYENEGFKAGVVYPCGAVVINDKLFVYYGGADSNVCVATADLDEFLKQLTYSETAVLDPAVIKRIN